MVKDTMLDTHPQHMIDAAALASPKIRARNIDVHYAAKQALQTEEPGSAAKVPFSHFSHTSCPVVLATSPVAQGPQLVCPAAADADPTSHGLQRVWPGMAV